jgi:regulator of protease activity HflC (stomatin/prohibitin superfamily)
MIDLREQVVSFGAATGSRGAESDRSAGNDQGLDGEADAGRARQARGHPQCRGRQAVADPHAEGEKQSAILRAEGQKQAAILQSEGQAKAIDTVFRAIHEGDADPKLLAYQYLQVLPQIAQGEANKVWTIPSEVTQALGRLTDALPGSNDRSET